MHSIFTNMAINPRSAGKKLSCGCFMLFCLLSLKTYIFANKVLLIFHDAPWSNADGTDLSSWLGGVVFQRITHMANHPCVCCWWCINIMSVWEKDIEVDNKISVRPVTIKTLTTLSYEALIYSAVKDKPNLLGAKDTSIVANVDAHTHTHTPILYTHTSSLQGYSCCPRGSSSQTWRPSYPISPADIHSFFTSTPSLPSIYPSIHYLSLSLPLSCLCTHSVTKSYFLFLSVSKCGLSVPPSTVSLLYISSYIFC